MYVIKYNGTVYDAYYQGNYSFNIDIGNWKVKRYKTKSRCEKAFNDLVKKATEKEKLSIICID